MRAFPRVGLAAVLTAVVFALNAPTWDYGFVYDDRAVVTDRKPVWEQGWKEFFENRQWGTGRHAVVLSFDYNRTEPLTPRPFHVVNTALAAVATVLVFALGVALGVSAPASFLAAALFAVHPIHADAIVSIIGRAELLAGISVLGCMVLHARGYPLWPLSIPLAALLFVVGAASKENALALPVLLVLYDWLLGPPASWRRRVLPYVAYGIAAAAWLAITIPNLDTLQPIAYVDNPLAYMPAWERIPRAAALLWHYLGLVLLPISSKPERSFAVVNPTLLEGVIGTVVWLVVVAACWRARKSDPLAVFLTLWFPAAFAVTANILYPIGTIMAERLLFAPSAGVLLLVGLLFDRVTAHASLGRRAVGVVGGIAVLLLAFAYDARARVWANDSHYHFVAAIESPASAKAHYNLGLERAAAEDFTAAEAAFRRALEIYPKFDLATYYLAGVLIQTDRPEEAIDLYKAYLALAPDDAGALSQLVTLELGVDRYEDARASAQRLVALDPENLGHQGLLDTVEMMMTARNRPVGPSVLEGELERWEPKAPH